MFHSKPLNYVVNLVNRFTSGSPPSKVGSVTRCGSGIPLVAHPTARKWVITPVTNGISRVNLLIYIIGVN